MPSLICTYAGGLLSIDVFATYVIRRTFLFTKIAGKGTEEAERTSWVKHELRFSHFDILSFFSSIILPWDSLLHRSQYMKQNIWNTTMRTKVSNFKFWSYFFWWTGSNISIATQKTHLFSFLFSNNFHAACHILWKSFLTMASRFPKFLTSNCPSTRKYFLYISRILRFYSKL